MSLLRDVVDGLSTYPVMLGVTEKMGSGIILEFAKSLMVGAVSALVVMYAGLQVLEERSSAFASKLVSMETTLDKFTVLIEERQLVLDRVGKVAELARDSTEQHEKIKEFSIRMNNVEGEVRELKSLVDDHGYWLREKFSGKRR